MTKPALVMLSGSRRCFSVGRSRSIPLIMRLSCQNPFTVSTWTESITLLHPVIDSLRTNGIPPLSPSQMHRRGSVGMTGRPYSEGRVLRFQVVS